MILIGAICVAIFLTCWLVTAVLIVRLKPWSKPRAPYAEDPRFMRTFVIGFALGIVAILALWVGVEFGALNG